MRTPHVPALTRALILALALLAALFHGCAPLQANSAESKTIQIIVKFKAGVAAPSPEALRALGGTTGTSLTYLRPVSGGAHVLGMSIREPGASVTQVLERLNAQPEIEYAEPDRILHISQ